MPPRYLVLYATEQGQTQKISEYISEILSSAGNKVDVMNVRTINTTLDLSVYDAILVGASIHANGYSKKLKKWITSNTTTLNSKPTAFFSVCLGILQKEDAVQKAVRKIAEDFFVTCHWKPTMWRTFAGALTYSKYNWLVRRMMKDISKKAGGDTDTSRDYEYTNWFDVKAFANEAQSLIGNSQKSRAAPQNEAKVI